MAERAPAPQIRLEPWADTPEFLELLHRTNAPEMTEHLGGPETAEQVLARHQRYVRLSGSETAQMFGVVLAETGEVAGSIGYWEHEWRGEPGYETGWGVLPAFQGRGIAAAAVAAAAVAAAAAAARAERGHRWLHAFPSVDNLASNALCRRAGFTLVEACDFEYPPGNLMRCNDWRLDLAPRPGEMPVRQG
ncbi:GNAT family N-acetyltransferase [Kitasatospora sp. NBC_01287]|uniref:GNAT family N-acetyltransferase n=1 Tax=Kitasatospora sp. NBC_01287 TaxID=2903573 RepID=UPI00224E6299|nr:GNAT family N-acetyltransferase [Kitasatospora sp. NBC_01287]MCX4747900.1 GNAT family N-acetyltransferase [Kitasatospora sp. NBC_01287]